MGDSDAMILLPHFTRALVIRSFFTWLVLRMIAVAGTIMVTESLSGGRVSAPILLSPSAILILILSVTASGWIYMRLRNEDRFLLSLGFGPIRQITTLLIVPILAEISILLVLVL